MSHQVDPTTLHGFRPKSRYAELFVQIFHLTSRPLMTTSYGGNSDEKLTKKTVDFQELKNPTAEVITLDDDCIHANSNDKEAVEILSSNMEEMEEGGLSTGRGNGR